MKLFGMGTKASWAAAAAGALLLSGAVNAATVTATFTGVNPGGSVSGQVPNRTAGTGGGGIFNFTRTAGDAPALLPGSGSPDNYFVGICIEFNELIASASVGSTHTWTLAELHTAPVTANMALPFGMGVSKANDIRLLLGHVLPSFESASLLSNVNALALQIAIWEIVHENPINAYEPRNVTGKGSAYFYSPSRSGAVTQAYTWLDNLNKGNPLGWKPAQNLFALTKNGAQDFIVQIVPPQVVPLPAAAWLLGSGLLGLFAVARRKKTAV